MKLLSSSVAAPVVLAAFSILVGCSSDNSSAGAAGSGPGGASSGGKAGSAGSSGGSVSVGGAGAGGTAGSVGIAGSAGAGTAGAGTSGGPSVEASFATVKSMISSTCFGNGCHNGEGNRLQMPINDALYTTMMNHTTLNCGKLLNTANAADSALVKVLKGDCGTAPNTTPRMPLGICFDGDTDPDSPCIQPDKIAAIQAWIAKGAPQQ
jgi:hypothetical protein